MDVLGNLLTRKRRQLNWRLRLHFFVVVASCVASVGSLVYAIVKQISGDIQVAAAHVLAGDFGRVDLGLLVEDQGFDVATLVITLPIGAVLMLWQVRHQKITLLLAHLLAEEGEKDTAVRVLLTSYLDGDPGVVELKEAPSTEGSA